MTRGGLLLVAALALSADVRAEQPRPEPQLSVSRREGGNVVGFGSGGFTIEGSLGAHELKWADVSVVDSGGETASVTLLDGTKLTGAIKDAGVTLRMPDGSKQEVAWKDIRQVRVAMLIPPPPRVKMPEVGVPARGAPFRCSGLAATPSGDLVALDRGNRTILWLDASTLAEKRTAKLDAEPLISAPVPGGRHLAVAVPRAIKWIDAGTGATAATAAIPFDPVCVSAPSEDLAAASDGKTLVVVSRTSGTVKLKQDMSASCLLMPFGKPDTLFTTSGPVQFDLDAGSRNRPPFWSLWDEGPPVSSEYFVRADGGLAVTASGRVARLGRGATACWVEVGTVPQHLSGYFTPDGASLVLFGPQHGAVVVQTSDWKVARTLAFPFTAYVAVPLEKGAVVLGKPSGQPFEGSALGHFRQATPAEIWRVSLEE